MQRKRVNDIKATISEMFDLPKDIVLDLPKIIMVGGNQILVENHKGIIEYTPDRIRINSSIGVIRVLGANMMLKNIGQDDIMVTGTIKTIELLS
jgi:sporulation protein YqfC